MVSARRCDVLRVYDTARTVHLERLLASRASRLVYRRPSYDFDAGRAHLAGAERLGRARTMVYIIRARPRVLELNEPGQLNAWPSTLLYVTLLRFLKLLRLTHTRLVYYAIENADTLANLRTYKVLKPAPLYGLARFVYLYLLHAADRVAFGTTAAMRQYARGGNHIRECRLIPALPAAQQDLLAKENVAIFLGSFERRKGILELMGAWDLCRPAGSRLRILGKGPLINEVSDWASSRSDVDLVVDPGRDLVWDAVARAKVLVLFSQRETRWREQVGLPIVEGLSYGCEIVASAESGLAEWLTANGHRVLDPDVPLEALASAIDGALAGGRSPQEIVKPLPDTDGRLAADDWLTD